jgi:CBS domain-containing protein
MPQTSAVASFANLLRRFDNGPERAWDRQLTTAESQAGVEGRAMNVEHLMNVPAITCNPDTSLEEVASLMWKNDIGFLPVVAKDTGQLVGIITDRDAVIGAFTQGKRLAELAADVSMARSVKTCRVGMQVEDAEQIMEMNQIHRLPVVDDEGRLVGVISLNDIARRAASDEIEILEQEVAVALANICQPRTNRLLH